jgi:purine-binding chemotaxis protein CheW
MSEMAQHPPALSEADAERAVLEKRARELARRPVGETATSEHVQIVEFTMAHERYGVEARYVREVHRLRELTPLPGTPAFVLGIINVRGRVTSLVDLKKFFALPEKGLSDTNHVVLLSSSDMEFGILADSMLGVRALAIGDLQGDLPTFTGHRKDYLLGVARDGVVVLDARRILADPRIVVRDDDADQGGDR